MIHMTSKSLFLLQVDSGSHGWRQPEAALEAQTHFKQGNLVINLSSCCHAQLELKAAAGPIHMLTCSFEITRLECAFCMHLQFVVKFKWHHISQTTLIIIMMTTMDNIVGPGL